MWLVLSQFLKQFTEGNARKLAVNFTDLVLLTSQKTRAIQALRAILALSLLAAAKL